jgi:hypothetical protein
MGKREWYGPLVWRTRIVGKFRLVLTLGFNLYILLHVFISLSGV